MEDTRVELIQELDDWEKSEIDAVTMMWMYGGAGTGKTALLLTFADLCKRYGRVVGAFFASNRIANCGDGDRIVATLAIQLIESLPSTKSYVYKAIRKDRHLFTKGREVQISKLIIEPIKKVARFSRFLKALRVRSYPSLIIIDGLDEVTGKDVQSDIIRIIGDAMKDIRLPLRFLIASRPEPHIVDAVGQLQSHFPGHVSKINLSEDALARRDIEVYLRKKLAEARSMHPEVPPDWPGPEIVSQLADKASGHFIYATTVMAYIITRYCCPDERLGIIRGLLRAPPGDAPFAQLDFLYTHITSNANNRHGILKVLGQLLIARNMLSEHDILGSPANSSSPKRLEAILRLKPGDIRRILTDMHSLLKIGSSHEDIKILHASFPDFLFDPLRSKDFIINTAEACVELGLGYIRTICNLSCTSELQLQRTTLTFVLCFRIISSVANFVHFEEAGTFERLVGSAVKYCTEAGLGGQLSEGLNRVLSQYELFVYSAPWKRHPATLTLKKIYTLLAVGFFKSLCALQANLLLGKWISQSPRIRC